MSHPGDISGSEYVIAATFDESFERQQ